MSDLNACEVKQCYRWGGIAALLLAIGYVVIIPLFAWAGAPPATGEAWFRYLPGKTTVWWAIIWLSRSHRSALSAGCLGAVDRLAEGGKKSHAGSRSLPASVCSSRSGSDLDASRFSAGTFPKLLQHRRPGSSGRLSGCGRICLLDLCDAAADLLRHCDSIAGGAFCEHRDD